MSNYHGWTNRETWATHLWLKSDEHLYNFSRGMVRLNHGEEQALSLRDWLEEARDMDDLMFQDIGDLSKVNWQEVAGALNGE